MNIKKPNPTPESHPNNHPHHDQDQNDYQMQYPPKQLHGFNQLPVQESQESEQGDILQKIDSLLQQDSNNASNQQQVTSNRPSQKQMLLNFKINQMQKIIHNLNQANKKLNRKLQDIYSNDNNQQTNNNNHNNNNQNNKKTNQNNHNKNNQSQNNMLNSSSESNAPFNDELTEMQGDFQQVEGLIRDYKEQLINSENKWNAIKEEKDEEIESLKNQILAMSQTRQLLQNQLNQFSQQNQLLKNKNQQLLTQIQNLQHQLQRRSEYSQQPYTNSPNRYTPNYYQTPMKKFQSLQDYKFNQSIQREMETMIKKLLKELGHQRKLNSKMNFQIKRLSSQLIQGQKKIKLKNDTIYKLQMKIIHIQKNYSLSGSNTNMPYNNQQIHHNTKRYTPINMSNHNSSLKYSPTLSNKPSTTHPNNTNKNQSINYQPTYKSKQGSYRQHKHQPQQILMKQYQAEYTQYSDSHQGNIYEEYGMQPPVSEHYVMSAPIKPNRSPVKTKLQNNFINTSGTSVKQQNLANNLIKHQFQQNNPIKHQFQANNNQTKTNDQQAFIKLKKPPQQQKPTPKQQQRFPHTNKSSSSPQQSKQFTSLTLMQLHQGKCLITMKQKIIIISRLIDLYCKKIKNKNYYNLIAQEIQVYNFNQKHPNLIRVKIIDAHSNNSKVDMSATLQQDTEESLMYNLAFIVENLIKQVQTRDQKDLQVDLNLGEIIEDILTKSQQDKISYFQELSKSLENSVTAMQ